jgi:hypothetical protein
VSARKKLTRVQKIANAARLANATIAMREKEDKDKARTSASKAKPSQKSRSAKPTRNKYH